MTDDDNQTKPPAKEFDYSSYPPDTLFHERREGTDRRHRGDAGQPATPSAETTGAERRQKKERRRRIDPTTFEKEYPPRTTSDAPLASGGTA
jgi:hypothetical protein